MAFEIIQSSTNEHDQLALLFSIIRDECGYISLTKEIKMRKHSFFCCLFTVLLWCALQWLLFAQFYRCHEHLAASTWWPEWDDWEYIYVFTGAKSSLLARCRTGGCNIMFERMVRRICLTFFLFCTQQDICTLVNALVEYIHAKLAVSSSYWTFFLFVCYRESTRFVQIDRRSHFNYAQSLI